MKTNAPYNIFVALLSLTILFGFISPITTHAGMMEHCETMDMHKPASDDSMHNHMDMDNEDCCGDQMPMNHQPGTSDEAEDDSCHMNLECDCYFTSNAVRTEVPVLQKVKVPKPLLSNNDFDVIIVPDQYFPPPLWFSNSYSPPLLFLTNESFLI